jgi:hypothetical protein
MSRPLPLVTLALAAWLAALIASAIGTDRANEPTASMPALGAIELAQFEHQARVLCARRRDASIALPDGALECAGTRRVHSEISIARKVAP